MTTLYNIVVIVVLDIVTVVVSRIVKTVFIVVIATNIATGCHRADRYRQCPCKS